MAATVTAPGPVLQRTTAAPLQRVQSVDLMRGLTIAFMVLVNDPGDWDHVFTQLDHADWNGWTLTDLVFPTFLFLVGVSMVFSLRARAARGDSRKTLSGHVALRSAKLLLLSFVLVYFPRLHWSTMRFYGVLPRIAVCSLLAGLLLVATMRLRRQAWTLVCVVAALLLGYWVLLRWVPVPGVGMPGRDVPFMDMNANLTSWLDRNVVAWTQLWLHTGRLYKQTRDPEGLLSTLPAVATVLLGALAGIRMRAPSSHANPRDGQRQMRLTLLALGFAGICLGELWGHWFPINKNLWTSSYVLLSAGWATVGLAALSWLVDDRREPWPRWLRVATWPWFVFGLNAIAAYTTSAVVVKAALYFKVSDADGDKNTVMAWIYETVFARHGSTPWTSLAFAVCFVGLCFLPNWYLWRKKWFWKM